MKLVRDLVYVILKTIKNLRVLYYNNRITKCEFGVRYEIASIYGQD